MRLQNTMIWNMHVLQLTEQNAGTTAGFFLFVVSATEK